MSASARTRTEIELPLGESFEIRRADGTLVATVQFVANTTERSTSLPQARLGITADQSVPILRAEMTLSPLATHRAKVAAEAAKRPKSE